MSNHDFFQWVMVALSWATLLVFMFIVNKRQSHLEDEWIMFMERRKELYDSLANPYRIEEELEKSARRREMYDANRTTLPRENSGPPATVYRPLLRGVKPGTWRPRNPGSPSKE